MRRVTFVQTEVGVAEDLVLLEFLHIEEPGLGVLVAGEVRGAGASVGGTARAGVLKPSPMAALCAKLAFTPWMYNLARSEAILHNDIV